MGIFSELQRRNVFRVGLAYLVLGWLLLQVTDVVVPILELPGWVSRLVLFLLALGFPLVLIFSWAFELTPEGIRRERHVDRKESITGNTARKLDYAIIALLVLALGLFAWDRFSPQPESTETTAQVRHGDVAEAAAPDAAIPVVAVLPFKAAGSDDGGFLAGGLHDDLLTRLAKLGAFRVISRTSMMEYANSTKNMPEIGQELGAQYILEGAVQAHEKRVRINAQLIDAASDTHLWAESYDRELTAVDLFDVQAELAVAIAGAMKTTINPEDRALVEEIPTASTQAYSAYLRAIQLGRDRGFVGPQNLDVVEAFEEAVALDPEFAEAWAHLAIWRIGAAAPLQDADLIEGALEALARARVLKPDLLENELAWSVYLYRIEREYAQAIDVLEELGARASGNVEALQLKSYLYRRLGRYREAREAGLQAMKLAPRSPSVISFISQISMMLDDCETAGNYGRKALEIAQGADDYKAYLANYELQCNGDAQRASELVRGLDLTVVFDTWEVALWAAILQRDAERYSTIIETDTFILGSLSEVWRTLNRAWLYRYLQPDRERLEMHLDLGRQALQRFEQRSDIAESAAFAAAMVNLGALSEDPEVVRYWVAEQKRRYHVEYKGDLFEEANNRWGYSQAYAAAGLLDEAIAELRTMLEEPGGYRFPLVDGFPEYDVLRDHPEYIELKERFGSVNLEADPDQ